MSITLEDALATALDDEFKARAAYRAVLAAFGDIRPFVNIVESEERHIAALKRLYASHGLEPPADRWAGRMTPPSSVEAACQAAIEGERENAEIYAGLLAAVAGHADVERTFRRLLAASQENHLPAFERGLRREQGGMSEPDGSRGGGPGRRRRRQGRSQMRIEER